MDKIKKVLVVDDSKLARLTLARLLIKRNITVIEADSVQSALKVLQSESFDAIFLDVQMPEQSGFDGLKILKDDEHLRHIPCSMYSGDLSVEAQQKAIDSGAQAYLFKPANGESLDHVLQALSANIIADDMQQYTQSESDSVTINASRTQKSSSYTHRKALLTLDGRTRNLARLFSKEKQETGNAVTRLNSQLSEVNRTLASLKKQKEYSMHDELLHKRAENDIRGQLQKTRDNLRLATTVAIAASIIAILALAITGIVYFNQM